MKRHFRIIFYYLLAKIYFYIGLYDRSVLMFSKVTRYRVFFFDTQDSYMEAYKKSSKSMLLEIHGGVGDFLQCLPFMLKNPKANYIVISHFQNTKKFFEDFNLNVKHYCIYSKLAEYANIREELKILYKGCLCPRTLFFESSPFQSKYIKNNKVNKFTVGIHFGSSEIAKTKELPARFMNLILDELISSQFNIIVFGQKALTKDIKPHPSIKKASDENIVKNLSKVSECDILIGSDSAFKTMSSMLKIPTIVIFNKDKNNYRDRVFIAPYAKKKVLYKLQYNFPIKISSYRKILLETICILNCINKYQLRPYRCQISKKRSS